jgi:ABC-type sugar transport system substrate-binding protein
VADSEDWDFVAIQSANWSRTEAQEVAQNVLQSSGNGINVIYCHNDEMALGASLAVQAAGLEIGKDILIIGVDGMKESLDAIKAGTQSLSVTCTPKYADLIFDTIEDGINGKEIPTSIDVQDAVVDTTNVEQFYDLGF